MKERRGIGIPIAAFGMGIMVTSAVIVVLVIITGLSNRVFSWWEGIPVLDLYFSAVVAGILTAVHAFRNRDFVRQTMPAESASYALAAIAGAVLLVVVLRSQFAPWFSEGGWAWFKLGGTAVGTAILGIALAAAGVFLTTGGK